MAIEEIDGRWTCTDCGYEWSAMLGDNEVPEVCECQPAPEPEPVTVWQVLNAEGYDAGNDWRMAIFDTKDKAREYIEYLNNDILDVPCHFYIRERTLT